MLDTMAEEQIFGFGPFNLHKTRRKLFCGAEEVRIGGRGMDVLLALAGRPGELVGKRELMLAGWPDTFVQDANLKVTVAYLRRALRRHAPSGEFINTVVGRGYWLSTDAAAGDPGAAPRTAAGHATLPAISEIIGREAEIARLTGLLASHRLVTIAGPGGIGKTTLATAVAHQVVADIGRPVAFVDLSRVRSEEFVAGSLAASLGISSGGDSLQSVFSILSRQKMLLVLDTCEHVLSAVAHICEVLLARTEQVVILVTSREVLRARSEQVLWLAPLAIPPDNGFEEIGPVLAYAAPRLLATRASEKGGYVPQDADARPLVEICRELDGSPLAIELVAPRLAMRGAALALAELEGGLLLLRRQRREGPRRHRTLLDTLKWSYSLLTTQEASALRAFSVFAGPFTSDAALEVASSAKLSPVEIIDAIAGLRSKSMVAVEHRDHELRYHLLDSTRAFAGDLLERHEEKVLAQSSHARWVLEMLIRAVADQPVMSQGRWRSAYVMLIHDLRKAIEWTLRRSADSLLGIRLVAAGLPLWHELSLGEEVRDNCELALAEFHRLGCSDAALELKLVVGLATVSTYLKTDPHRASSLFESAVELARETGDPQAECRALGAFATYELMRCRGEAVSAALAAMRAAALRTNHPAAVWEEEQLRAQYEIRMCDFDAALARVRRLSEEMRGEAERAVPRFQIHQKMNVQVQLAALNWLTGRSGDALRVAAMAAADAAKVEHGLTLVHCLAQGVVWTLVQCGEYEAVLPHIRTLRDAIYRHGIAAWIPVADTYSAALAAFFGEKPDPARLRSAFYGVRAGAVQIRHDARYALIAEAMLANGQAGDAAEVVRHVFDHSPEPWGRSEFLRLQAATERAMGNDGHAGELLAAAVEQAEASGSIAWSLRSVRDLAALLANRGETQSARALLAPICQRFADESNTGDLHDARKLLARLS